MRFGTRFAVNMLLVALIVSASFQLVTAQTTGVKKQTLGFTKNSFLYELNEKLKFYNELSGTNIYLGNEEMYYPLERRDGWVWNFSNKMGLVGVAGPEDNLEEAYCLMMTSATNGTILFEDLVVFTSFARVLFPDNQQFKTVTGWVIDKSTTPPPEQIVGNKNIKWIIEEKEGAFSFGLRVSGAPATDPLPPWWVILGIIGTTIGISTFVYKVIITLRNRRAYSIR